MSFSLNDTKTRPLLPTLLLSCVLSKSSDVCNSFIAGMVLSISHVGNWTKLTYLPVLLPCLPGDPPRYPGWSWGVESWEIYSQVVTRTPSVMPAFCWPPGSPPPRLWPWLWRLPGSWSHFCQTANCAIHLTSSLSIRHPFGVLLPSSSLNDWLQVFSRDSIMTIRQA